MTTGKNRFYLLGIGGTGMGNLACMLKELGQEVFGVDTKLYPPMSTFLQEQGIQVFEGYDAKHIEEPFDLAIVGNVIRADNPEAKALLDSGKPYTSMPEALRDYFLIDRVPIVVAGTHGKTTTSSLLASCMDKLGMQPSFFIGGLPADFGVGARLGEGEHFVLEGDEYDSAFFLKQPKFLAYCPHHLILTSVEYDHADIYDNLEAIIAEFERLVQLMPPDGMLLVCGDDANARAVADQATCKVVRYGLSEHANFQAKAIESKDRMTTFEVVDSGKSIGQFTIPLIGKHNVRNALATIGLLQSLGQDSRKIQEAIAEFQGVGKRQQVVYPLGLAGAANLDKSIADSQTIVLEDFAHHPTAIRETILAAKNAYIGHRVIALFEPRSNTVRRNIYQKELASSLSNADGVVVYYVKHDKDLDIDPANRLDVDLLAKDCHERGVDTIIANSHEQIIQHLQVGYKAGDVLLMMSNGSFDGLKQKLIDWLD